MHRKVLRLAMHAACQAACHADGPHGRLSLGYARVSNAIIKRI
jgi:hypothetical protein